jgi:hypothetical protein
MNDRIASVADALRAQPVGWLTTLPPESWPDARADLQRRRAAFVAFTVPPGMVVVVSDVRPPAGVPQCETGASLSRALAALGTDATGKIEMSEAIAKSIVLTAAA